MNIYDWATFLAQWNTELLNDDEFTDSLPEEIKSSGWLGCPGATTKQIEMLEMRLGVKLPPSYHAFLSTSNGWKMTPFVRRIWSTEQVAWFHVRNQAWIDSYLASSAKSTSLPNAVSVTYDHQQTSTTIYIDHVQYTLEAVSYTHLDVYKRHTQSHSGSSANPYQYTGQYQDAATGLYQLRARYYQPGDGRFLSRDRMGLDQYDPAEWNRYSYARNNPVLYGDPLGLSAGALTLNPPVTQPWPCLLYTSRCV